mgnify:CR=1 FL=1
MKLFTSSIEKRLIKNYQSNAKNVKLFNPTGIGTWYLTEYNPETEIAFGLSCLHEKEIGYVSMKEIREYKGPFGLGIERDKYFDSNKKTMEECKSL